MRSRLFCPQQVYPLDKVVYDELAMFFWGTFRPFTKGIRANIVRCFLQYKKVRIDLGSIPKECLQSYKELSQSLDIFGVVHVHVCAQHRRAGVSAAVNFFGASTRLRRVSAPKKLTAASTPALLCFAHTCIYISYTKNVS